MLAMRCDWTARQERKRYVTSTRTRTSRVHQVRNTDAAAPKQGRIPGLQQTNLWVPIVRSQHDAMAIDPIPEKLEPPIASHGAYREGVQLSTLVRTLDSVGLLDCTSPYASGASGFVVGSTNRVIEGERHMQVFVRDNNVDQALKALKRKMQREGVFREMKLRGHYEKPSERRIREKAEAIRRAR